MNLIFIGPPGAGKGTHATGVAKILNIPHISTGDIFRTNIKMKTSLGLKADEYISKGCLVPDDITIDIVKDRLGGSDCKDGFILDGFPRTLFQAEALDIFLGEWEMSLDYVVNISIPDEQIIKRLCGRRVCASCGTSYHVEDNPPNELGMCVECGSIVVQRDDDDPATIRERLLIYHSQTEPLIAYYKNHNKLLDISSVGTIENVRSKIVKLLSLDQLSEGETGND